MVENIRGFLEAKMTVKTATRILMTTKTTKVHFNIFDQCVFQPEYSLKQTTVEL